MMAVMMAVMLLDVSGDSLTGNPNFAEWDSMLKNASKIPGMCSDQLTVILSGYACR